MNELEMYVCINGIYSILENGISKRSIKGIPPLVMASIKTDTLKVQDFFPFQMMSTSFRVEEPSHFDNASKKNILYEFGKTVRKEKQKVSAVFVAACFNCKEIDKETDEELNDHECFVISCLTKEGKKLARIIPLDRDPEGNILLLKTKNQFSENFDFDFIEEFYRGYDAGQWYFSKIFGDN